MDTRRVAIASILAAIVFILVTATASAYVPGRQLWVRTAGTATREAENADVAVDSKGAVYTVGDQEKDGGSVLLVEKFSAAGRKLWSRTYDGPGDNDWGQEIEVTKGGIVYVTADEETVVGRHDILLVKYTSAGAFKWTRGYGQGGSLDSEVSGLTIDGSGNAYVTGTADTPGGKTGIIALKVQPGGTIAWTQRFDPDELDAIEGPISANGLALDAARDVYVAGTMTKSGVEHALVVKLAGTDGSVVQSMAFTVLAGTRTGGMCIAVRGSIVAVGGWYKDAGAARTTGSCWSSATRPTSRR